MILLQTSLNTSSGLSISLRPLRRAPASLEAYMYKARGEMVDIRQLWATSGPFYPDDILDGGRMNVLEVSLIAYVY